MKPKNASRSKEQNMLHISACALSLEVNKGHLKWKVTELERKSGLSRSLIYRYFGSTKTIILRNALDIFVKNFYGIEGKSPTQSFPELVKIARQQVIDYPETALFYQKWRVVDSELAKQFARVEEKFQLGLKKTFPHFSRDQILTAHVCLHGIVTAPFISANQAEIICKQLMANGIFALHR